jgi:hypothetical protein
MEGRKENIGGFKIPGYIEAMDAPHELATSFAPMTIPTLFNLAGIDS